MEFSREFFLDEVIDGFFVPSMMKKAWAVSLMDYQALYELCLRHGVRCMPAWGTLIGTIREGGFVPWDDDMDFEILRDDFSLLESYAGKEDGDERYHVEDFEDAGNTNMVRRWQKRGVLIYPPDEWEFRYGFPFGSSLDLFILDRMPCDDEEILEYKKVVFLCDTFKNYVRDTYGDKRLSGARAIYTDNKFSKYVDDIEALTNKKMEFKSEPALWIQVLRYLDEYTARFGRDREDKEDVILANAAFYIGGSHRSSKSMAYSETFDMKFFNVTMKVPIGYDGILRRYYGDYMTPVRVFYNHSYPFYERLKDELKSRFGFSLLEYKFDIKEYESICTERKEKLSLTDEIRQSSALLKEAHAYLRGAHGSDHPDEETLDLLIQCQSLAVKIGESIEERSVTDKGIVSLLERYCESVYNAYEKGAQGIYTYDDLWDDVCKELDSVKLDEKKDIIFLVYKSDYWKSIYALWERESIDPTNNVYVIPIPYCYKDLQGIIPEDAWEVETKGFYGAVFITGYDDYDYENRHPHRIYFQCPYDEYSDVISVHPFFYSKNIRKYTDDLVFVPPFTPEITSDDDNRALYTIGIYLKNPGFIFADRVIVDSERIKDVYKKILSDFVETDRSKDGDVFDWDEKIICDTTLSEAYRSKRRVIIRDISDGSLYTRSGKPATISFYDDIADISSEMLCHIKSDDGSFKRVFVVSFSGSVIYEYGKRMISKIKSVLSEIKKVKDSFALIWHSDEYAEDILEKNAPDIWSEYQDLIKEYKDDTDIFIDDSKDTGSIALIADMYYGDGCILMNSIRRAGGAVLWETPAFDDVCILDDERGNVTVSDDKKMITVEGADEGMMRLDEFLRQ